MTIRPIHAAIMAFCAIILTAAPAMAYFAQATVALNVRTGPSTAYQVVDTLYQGERVDVRQCSGGWCQITHQGPDGFVSQRYLTRSQGRSPQPSQPRRTEPEVGFCIDAPNFRFGVNCDRDDFRDRPDRPRNARVCFYEDFNYNGRSFCARPGQGDRRLGNWNDRISSIRVFGGASAYVCEDWNFNGRCATVSNNRPQLRGRNNDVISSFRVSR